MAGSYSWNHAQPFNGKTAGLNELVGNWMRIWTVETRGILLDGLDGDVLRNQGSLSPDRSFIQSLVS